MRFCLVFCQYANSVLLCKVYTLQRIYAKISLSVCKTVFIVVYERVKSLEDASINALSGNSFIDLHAGDGGIDQCNVAITLHIILFNLLLAILMINAITRVQRLPPPSLPSCYSFCPVQCLLSDVKCTVSCVLGFMLLIVPVEKSIIILLYFMFT